MTVRRVATSKEMLFEQSLAHTAACNCDRCMPMSGQLGSKCQECGEKKVYELRGGEAGVDRPEEYCPNCDKKESSVKLGEEVHPDFQKRLDELFLSKPDYSKPVATDIGFDVDNFYDIEESIGMILHEKIRRALELPPERQPAAYAAFKELFNQIVNMEI